MLQTVTFPYKPGLKPSIFVFMVGAVLAVIAYVLSFGKSREITLFRVLPLNAEQSSWVLLACVAGFGLMAVVGIMMIIKALTSQQQIEITDQCITAPKGGMFGEPVTVMFSSIQDVKLESYSFKQLFVRVAEQRFLQILHDDGKLSLSQDLLGTKEQFEQMRAAFDERYRAFRGRG